MFSLAHLPDLSRVAAFALLTSATLAEVPNKTSGAAATREVVWNPLEKQESEPDTLYLLDGEAELKLKAGEGGLITGNASAGDLFPGKVIVTDGKFRKGLKSTVRDYGYLWMPLNGFIAPDEWTVEYWVKSDAPLATLDDMVPLIIWDEHEAVRLECQIDNGVLTLSFRHNQDPAGPVHAALRYDLKKNPLAVSDWHNLAYTFHGDTLRFYVNGKPAGEVKGLKPPRIWSDAARGDGLSLLGGYGRGANGLWISDLRISRRARVPGEKITVTAENVLTVTNQPTGELIEQNLLGGLHYFPDEKTAAMAKGVIKVLRTDKLLTATPIKAGAPDAAHLTPGISGKFAYDWQVVDRTFDYYKKLGVMPYISIDSTPEILGGKTPPFSGKKLTDPEAKSGASGFTPELPNDLEAFGSIVRDLVHYVVKVRKDRVPYWGVWNEPDGGSFFTAKIEDYLKVYAVSARAVKAVDSTLQVGGPETGEYSPKWIEALIKYCGTEKLPLDFVAWHYYLGELTEFSHARQHVAAWSKQYGLPGVPGLINGEWTWQGHNVAGSGYRPFSAYRYHINDWNAAFIGASLVEMQHAKVLLSIFTNPVAKADGTGWDASGLYSPDHPWATGNVFKLWSKMSPEIVQATYSGLPGIWFIASRDAQGRMTVFLSQVRYRKDISPQISIKLDGLRPAHPLKITSYVVDDAHSNAFDAGKDHAELETVAPPELQDGKLSLTMRPRSVHLLVLEPATN